MDTVASARGRRGIEIGWLGALALATSAWGLAPGLLNGPSFDAAVFTTVGWLMRHGLAPYRDAWDHKPPLVYLTDAGAQSLLPWTDPWLPVWLVSLLAAAASAVLVGLTVRRWTGARVAGLATVATAAGLTIYPIALGGGLTETLAALPMTLGCFVVLRPGAPTAAWGLAGVCAAASLAFSLQTLGMPLALLLLALTVPGERRWRRLAAAAFGGIAAAALIAAWLAWAGALGPAWDAVVIYSGAFRQANLGWQRPNANAPAAVATLTLLFLIIPAALGVSRALRRPAPVPQVAIAAAVWVVATIAFPLYLGRFETHYATIVVIPVALLAAVGIDRLLQPVASRPPAAVWVAFAAGIALSMTISTNQTQDLVAATRAEQYRNELVGGYVASHAQQGRIFVWGDEPQAYYVSGRLPAGKYPYLLPLTTPGYATDAAVQALLGQWLAGPPAIVIDAGSFAPGDPGAPPLLIPRPVDLQGRNLDILAPLREFVRQRYHLATTIDGWPVYAIGSS